MKHLAKFSVAAAIAWLGILAALAPPATAATDNSAALQADRKCLSAATAGNKQIAGGLLAADFEWTDAAGKTRSKAETLRDLSAFAANYEKETGVRQFAYDQLEVVTGIHHNARFMRVWVKRPVGWQAFAFIDTPISRGTAPFATTASAAEDCENPCRTLPFTPKTAADKEIAGLLMRLKMDEWHPNPEDWSPYVLDGVDYVTSAGALSKAHRVAHLEQEKKSGAVILPGDPVISMRMADFGQSAVMISLIAPYSGGKPYYSLRVWTYKDGRWQLANSQQTTIEAAKPVPPAAAKKTH
ncbi:MAG TPA: nuclear transport factor 2 family protein [Candidatus Dormibacteraeota bacterium]|nr:nuclear transport factor 2 family protein [Candidatus Dormibacteraeota bacterium]